jgi:hypothetical protein
MYAVLRMGKLKTMGEIGALGQHNERTRETRNADEARLGDNVRLAGTGDWCADAQQRLDAAPRIRSNAVLALEHVMTASRDFYQQGDAGGQAARLDEWTTRSMAWLRDRYGDANVVAAILHKDEQTPHIQALVVPLHDDKGLNAKYWIDGRAKLAAMQDSYARAMEPLGLERGVKGSVAEHQTVKAFYAKIEQPTPAPEVVRRDLAVEPPSRVVTNPDKWAAAQQERIAERLVPVVDAALVKAQHYEGQAAKAEANITVLQGQVREIARERDTLREDYKTLAAQVRAIDVPSVIERLGGQVDRYNAHKYHLAGEHISITGERFYNHDRGQGGGGAIDLVMHATRYDYREAVAYLRDTHGAVAAVGAATWHGARQAQRDAQEIVERAERPPFHAPAPDEARWPGVRHYLVEGRQLPAALVDELHGRGTIYADGRANAVFLRQDADGQATGASLRGTMTGSDFKGLAAGTRRDEGYFSFTTGQPDPYKAPQIYLTESPIDALSRAALLARAGAQGERIYISLDGHGGLPARQIDEGLGRRAVVHCGFDRDRGGDTMWERVRERYGGQAHETYGPIDRDRPPAGVKDWNEALQQGQGHAQSDGAGQHPHAPRSGQRPGEREREREDLADRRPS